MKLDDLDWKFKDTMPGADFEDKFGRIHCIRNYKDDGYAIFENVRCGEGKGTRQWNGLDLLQAQCILIGLVNGEV